MNKLQKNTLSHFNKMRLVLVLAAYSLRPAFSGPDGILLAQHGCTKDDEKFILLSYVVVT